MERRILSVGHNAAALRFRNALIQQAGYQVTTTKEAVLVLELACKQDFDTVVLCNSIPAPLRESLAGELKRLKPRQSLVILCADDEERKWFLGLAEETVIAGEASSGKLIEAINRLAGQLEEDGPQLARAA